MESPISFKKQLKARSLRRQKGVAATPPFGLWIEPAEYRNPNPASDGRTLQALIDACEAALQKHDALTKASL